MHSMHQAYCSCSRFSRPHFAMTNRHYGNRYCIQKQTTTKTNNNNNKTKTKGGGGGGGGRPVLIVNVSVSKKKKRKKVRTTCDETQPFPTQTVPDFPYTGTFQHTGKQCGHRWERWAWPSSVTRDELWLIREASRTVDHHKVKIVWSCLIDSWLGKQPLVAPGFKG